MATAAIASRRSQASVDSFNGGDRTIWSIGVRAFGAVTNVVSDVPSVRATI